MLRLTLYRRMADLDFFMGGLLWTWTLALNETLKQPRSHGSLLLGPRGHGGRVREEPRKEVDIAVGHLTANGGLQLAVSR